MVNGDSLMHRKCMIVCYVCGGRIEMMMIDVGIVVINVVMMVVIVVICGCCDYMIHGEVVVDVVML